MPQPEWKQGFLRTVARPGVRRGRLTLLRLVKGKKIWTCRCDCGTECRRDWGHLVIGLEPMCGGCIRKVKAHVRTLSRHRQRKFALLESNQQTYNQGLKARRKCGTDSRGRGTG